MKNQVNCPACDSSKTAHFEKTSVGHLSLGPDFTYQEIYYKCAECGEEGDYLAETDENFLLAQKEAQSIMVKKILESLHKQSISMSFVERALELPARTLTRWKNGDFSATTLALLRTIITYPWILDVAENNFDPTYASITVIKAAYIEFQNKANNGPNLRFHIMNKPTICTTNVSQIVAGA